MSEYANCVNPTDQRPEYIFHLYEQMIGPIWLCFPDQEYQTILWEKFFHFELEIQNPEKDYSRESVEWFKTQIDKHLFGLVRTEIQSGMTTLMWVWETTTPPPSLKRKPPVGCEPSGG